MKPVIMRMVVDLPAPFGPRKPSTSPFSTVNEMPSTARLGPKAFTRLSILIIAKDLEFGVRAVIIRTSARANNYGPDPEFRSARFSHKPKDETHADVKDIPSRAVARLGRAAFAGAELSGEAGAHHRAVRAGWRLRLHRALHRAATDRLARQAGHRRE